MPFCDGSTSATIRFKFPGEPEDGILIETGLPIEVQEVNLPRGIFVRGHGFGQQCVDLPDYELFVIDPGTATITGTQLTPNGICGPGTGQFLISLSDGRTVRDPLYTNWQPTPTAFFREAVCGFRVRDNQGRIVFEKLQTQCPEYVRVSCGDECPEGYCKCPTLKYPGYCCCKCSKAH